MRIAVMYSGIKGHNGADYVAKQLLTSGELYRDFIAADVISIGKEGGYDIKEALLQIQKEQPSFVLHSSAWNLKPWIVEQIQKVCPLIIWTHNDEFSKWRKRIRPVSEVATIHYSYSKVKHYHNAKYLPLAASDTHFFLYPPEYLDNERIIDVAMIGCGHPWRAKFLKDFAYRWRKCFFDTTLNLPTYLLNRIYNYTKVVIAPHQHCDDKVPGSAWGCPCRTFEVPAAMAFQLQVERGGLADVFPISATMPSIMDPERAADSWYIEVRRCLDSFEYRRDIATRQHRHVMANHLYHHRLQTIISDLKELGCV